MARLTTLHCNSLVFGGPRQHPRGPTVSPTKTVLGEITKHKRVLTAIVFGVIVLAGSLTAAAAQAPQGREGGAPPPPLQNLQVFPKDTPRAQVVTAMQAFSAALGVTCNHCHVFNGPGDPMNDFAGDTKPTKNMARAMMRMVQDMNAKVPTAVNKAPDQAARVTCGMCHRGATTPTVAPGTPGAPPPPRGAGPGGAPPAGAPPAGRGN